MDFEGHGFRVFIAETREKATQQLDSVNVGQEFKDVLSDLIKVADGTEELLRSGAGQSADVRILKSKFDQTKQDLFQTKKTLDKVRKEMFDVLSDEVVKISTQLKSLNKSIEQTDTTSKCVQSIQTSMKTMVNKIAELNKDS